MKKRDILRQKRDISLVPHVLQAHSRESAKIAASSSSSRLIDHIMVVPLKRLPPITSHQLAKLFKFILDPRS